jgi:hypothetical protein
MIVVIASNDLMKFNLLVEVSKCSGGVIEREEGI